jgi:hypothetical protein
MDARIDFVRSHNSIDQSVITHSPLIKGHSRIQRHTMAAGKIIQNNNVFVRSPQALYGYAPNIPCTTGHKDCQSNPLMLNFSLAFEL